MDKVHRISWAQTGARAKHESYYFLLYDLHTTSVLEMIVRVFK